jgi:hypothetical protein
MCSCVRPATRSRCCVRECTDAFTTHSRCVCCVRECVDAFPTHGVRECVGTWTGGCVNRLLKRWGFLQIGLGTSRGLWQWGFTCPICPTWCRNVS